MVLTVGIKTKLKEYHQKLIRSRLNGKSAYDKLMANGDEDLPNPLDMATQMKIEINSPNAAKRRTIVGGFRPHTAANHNRTGSLVSTGSASKINLNLKVTKAKTAISQTSFAKLFAPPVDVKKNSIIFQENKKKAMQSADLIKIRPASGELLGSTSQLRSVNRRNPSQISSVTRFFQRDIDVVEAFENIVGEEYDAFEEQEAPGGTNRRTNSITYFNSAFISPNATRIYSSKAGSPFLPASPLNRRTLSSAKI